MKKNENEMCAAVAAHVNWKSDNTRVEIFNGELSVILHGNYIYRVIDGVKWFSLAGWDTQTTRSRLRALGVELTSKGGERYHNGVRHRAGNEKILFEAGNNDKSSVFLSYYQIRIMSSEQIAELITK